MIDHSDMENKLSEDEVTIRSHDVHTYHLQALRENPDTSKQTYGVVSDCPFHALEYFGVSSCFPPDLMHGFLEGAIPQVLCQLFFSLHKEKIISLDNICSEIEAFEFGKNDRGNKPQKINKVSQTGAPVNQALQVRDGAFVACYLLSLAITSRGKYAVGAIPFM